jgi:hypothetical protein
VFRIALPLALATASPALPAASVTSDAVIAVCFSPKPDKPEPNRRFRTCSALGRAGYFWMICRFTSARIFPQRGCKLNEPNGFEPLRRVHDRIIRALSPINFAQSGNESVRKGLSVSEAEQVSDFC